jgi:hypothetical protein
MNVKELVQKLARLDPDSSVLVTDASGECLEPVKVTCAQVEGCFGNVGCNDFEAVVIHCEKQPENYKLA